VNFVVSSSTELYLRVSDISRVPAAPRGGLGKNPEGVSFEFPACLQSRRSGWIEVV
jgi:hypothetical protein